MSDTTAKHPLIRARKRIDVPPTSNDMAHVAVWMLDLRTLEVDDTCIDALLNRSERAQGARMRDAHQARLWRAVRASLRLYLANEDEALARRLEFESGPHGKPTCGKQCFNVSHSADIGLVAIGSECDDSMSIGVDVEQCQARRDTLALSRIVCTEQEQQSLCELEADVQDRAFTRTWARKEAWLKAHGVGLGFGASRVHVGVHDTPDPIRVDDTTDNTSSIVDLNAPAGYAMALCTSTGEEAYG